MSSGQAGGEEGEEWKASRDRSGMIILINVTTEVGRSQSEIADQMMDKRQ